MGISSLFPHKNPQSRPSKKKTTRKMTAARVIVVMAAAACAGLAALLSWFGVIHAWQFTSSDTVLQLGWGVGRSWALGYTVMALVFLATRWGLRPQR